MSIKDCNNPSPDFVVDSQADLSKSINISNSSEELTQEELDTLVYCAQLGAVFDLIDISEKLDREMYEATQKGSYPNLPSVSNGLYREAIFQGGFSRVPPAVRKDIVENAAADTIEGIVVKYNDLPKLYGDLLDSRVHFESKTLQNIVDQVAHAVLERERRHYNKKQKGFIEVADIQTGDDGSEYSIIDSFYSDEDRIAYSEWLCDLNAMIAGLDASDKQIINYLLWGMPKNQIAQLIGKSPSYVTKWKKRFEKKLTDAGLI